MRAEAMSMLLLLGLLSTGCAAPVAAPGVDDPGVPIPAPAAKSLVVATDTETDGFGDMFAGGKSGPEQLQVMVHRALAEADDKGTYTPGVATVLPSVQDGTWRILPDGRSETVWHLHPNARWHDGSPFTSQDVLFSWRVATALDVPYKSRHAANLIEDVAPLGQDQVVIRWKTVFVGAGRLTERDLFLLPQHLLQDTFLNDRPGFVSSTYWATGFIGVGPYRIVDWVPGSHVQVEAFPGFYGDPPRIRHITFKTIPDINTAVATIRAGAVDVWLGSSLGIEYARDLKAQWESQGLGQVMAYPRLIFEIRLAPEDPKVADVRTRKALYHAIDRETIVRDLYFGLLSVAHTYVTPGTSGFETIDARLTKYPFDPVRTQALMTELGWQKGADGMLRDNRGEPYTLPFATTSGNREREQLQSVIANMWKAAGFDVVIQNVPLARQNDPDYRFPTTDLSGISTDFEANIPRIDGRNRRSAQNPRGANVWGYANDRVDLLLDDWNRTMERARQIEIEAEALRYVSEDLPILPINYRIEAITVAKGVRGVPSRTSVTSATNAWNVEFWDRS